jgi:hypothetical protein
MSRALPLLALAALVAAPLASALVPGLPGSPAPGQCPATDFIPGTTLVAGGPGQWVKATFRVDAPLSGTFWAEIGATASTTNGVYGFFAERALVAGFFEDASGRSLGIPGFEAYPYGDQLDLNGNTLRLSAGDLHGCAAAAAGTTLDLQPGTYTVVVVGAGETGGAVGAALPRGVAVVATQTGSTTTLSESGYRCATDLRLEAEGFSTEVLQGCSTSYAASHTAYRALFTGHAPDANHHVSWTNPDGSSTPVAFVDVTKGGAGTYALEIPTYVSLFGQPFIVGPPADSGVFGAFADVP